jgi:hypothetical protein
MPPEDQHSTEYTALAVQLGILQEGQRNTLSGIDEIKQILTDHSGRLGGVETEVVVLKTRVDTLDAAQKEERQDSKPEKGRWANIGAFIVAAAAVILTVLDRFYLPTH